MYKFLMKETREFKTQKEADDFSRVFSTEMRDKFCPVIRGSCRNIACLCYEKSVITETDNKINPFFITTGFCTHPDISIK